MVASLSDLERDLGRALESENPDRVRSVRRTIADAHPATPTGAEASYRLGLTALFVDHDLDEAVLRLRAAAKAKQPPWTAQARISLGLLLHREGKAQQAAFELRKVASKKTLAGAQALGFMVIIYRESDNAKEADRARGEQMKLLAALAKSEDAETAGLAHYLLGMEHAHDGARKDAARHIEAAIASGGLAADDADNARAALKRL